MAMFNAGIALPPLFRRWDLSAMVETQGSHERAVGGGGSEERSKPLQKWRSP